MLEPLHPADIAELIKESWTHDAQYVYNLLDEEKAADVLVEMDDDVRDGFLASLSSEQIAKHVDNLDSDDAADLIADLPGADRRDNPAINVYGILYSCDFLNFPI